MEFRSRPILAAAAIAVIGMAGGGARAMDISGAGSTFVYPVLAKWAADYADKTGNHINYQSIGSGGGIAQIKAATVDFGASDKPLDPDTLAKLGTRPISAGHRRHRAGGQSRRASRRGN